MRKKLRDWFIQICKLLLERIRYMSEAVVLVNKTLNVVYYKVQSNASNLSGGVNYCRIAAGDYAGVKKILLMNKRVF
jgi:hypothetical protein